MSDPIKHECGIAMIRLLKPLRFYKEKYGTSLYGLNKLCLLMEKQHNRGQDGAGMANIKFDISPGNKYISIQKSNTTTPIKDIFHDVSAEIAQVAKQPGARPEDPEWLKKNARFTGELFLGHLRYGTYGGNGIERCHPFLRESNWMTRSLVVAGNFNLTNTEELFQRLVNIGQHPKDRSDTVTVLEKIGHYLDKTTIRMEEECIAGGMTRREAEAYIAKNLDVMEILRNACEHWDGGYVIAGLIGHGDSFVLRDPAGIRPAFYYVDDEVAVVTSERPVIQTTFNIQDESLIHELPPGHAIVVKRYGAITVEPYTTPLPEPKRCSFERIYFSRGTDADIYQERKKLGKHLAPEILRAINEDMENTVFSFIPNTAEICYYGLMDALREHCVTVITQKLMELKDRDFNSVNLKSILALCPRFEKVAVKDAKLRTFIAADASRDDLVAHVYDITYGTIRRGLDTLVIIDDSIVRGTTMRESILKILDRLGPKRILLVSSAPQIRYPDCYGIDMAKLGDFVAFQAAIELLKESNQLHVIEEVYRKAKSSLCCEGPVPNYVQEIYAPFTAERLSAKIAELLAPVGIRAEVSVIFQTIEGLHEACPNHTGDWYFTGNYPTPGGAKVCNRAFINYIEGRNERAY
mgnify:FL=1